VVSFVLRSPLLSNVVDGGSSWCLVVLLLLLVLLLLRVVVVAGVTVVVGGGVVGCSFRNKKQAKPTITQKQLVGSADAYCGLYDDSEVRCWGMYDLFVGVVAVNFLCFVLCVVLLCL